MEDKKREKRCEMSCYDRIIYAACAGHMRKELF